MANSILDKYLNEDKLKHLAQESIDKFTEIARNVTAKLSEDVSYSPKLFAYPNNDSFRNLVKISNELRHEYQKLKFEPTVGRVVIHFPEKNEVKEYYICRATPPTGIENLISYRSQLGRLAALEVDEEYDLGEETRLEQFDEQYIIKIQQATFKPIKSEAGWDSRKTEYRDLKELQLKTINSLLKVIEKKEEIDPQKFLESFLQEQDQKNNVIDGIRKEIIERFTLPDQIFLDTQQDNIFRQPLNYSLLLLGPAGTGKTTTLIRRLGQKLDFENGLLEEEKNLVLKVFESQEAFKSSWVMFTPTELLKSYLKEAFNRENVPASDEHITTWDSYRNELGRSLKILHTSKFESGFFADPNVITLREDFDDVPALVSQFQNWLAQNYNEEIKQAIEKSYSLGFFKDSPFVAKFQNLMSRGINSGRFHLDEMFVILFANQKEISELYKKERSDIENAIKTDLGNKLKKDNKFLDEYADFLASLEKNEPTEVEENEDLDTDVIDDEDDDGLPGNERNRNAIKKYRTFVMWLASKPAGFDASKSNSKNAKQLEWLGDRIPAPDVLKSINQSSNKFRCLGVLNNPLNEFFNSIASRYGKFRKQEQSENRFYHPDAALRKKINILELDLLIFTKLKIATELLKNPQLGQSEPRLTSSLKIIRDNYKAQVFVDEAPDFSPIQLGCMKLLVHPKINSFFACGDFNQRLVSHGTKDITSFKKFLSDSDINDKSITTPYRQTKSLYKFSLKILEHAGWNPNISILQENIHANKGFHPVLGENLHDRDTSIWIADRILEIEKILDGNIPSIAILVPTEEYVIPIANQLKEELNKKTSVLVQACHEGQTVGDGRAIRVFDIKHIKGLEFEAAFFVSLDKLALQYPDLISNYLYVGSTRAAQFLGVTCEQKLPMNLGKDLRDEFVSNW